MRETGGWGGRAMLIRNESETGPTGLMGGLDFPPWKRRPCSRTSPHSMAVVHDPWLEPSPMGKSAEKPQDRAFVLKCAVRSCLNQRVTKVELGTK